MLSLFPEGNEIMVAVPLYAAGVSAAAAQLRSLYKVQRLTAVPMRKRRKIIKAASISIDAPKYLETTLSVTASPLIFA